MSRTWKRAYTDHYLRLDIRLFHSGRSKRENLIEPGSAFNWTLTSHGRVGYAAVIRVQEDYLTIQFDSTENQRVDTKTASIALERTACKLGGSRAWMLCPCCSKRVAILYGWGRFTCRDCIGVFYQCHSETDHDRALRRAGKLRRRLGWEPGVANPNGGRPKGMHDRTYAKLLEQYARERRVVYIGLSDWLASKRKAFKLG